jgi:hypothetical protein
MLCPSVIVRFGPIPLKKTAVIRCKGTSVDAAARFCRFLCGPLAGHRDQFGHLSKVLGGGCEDELVMRTIWAS